MATRRKVTAGILKVGYISGFTKDLIAVIFNKRTCVSHARDDAFFWLDLVSYFFDNFRDIDFFHHTKTICVDFENVVK